MQTESFEPAPSNAELIALVRSLSDRVTRLEDERAIRRLAHDYCIGADHRDRERWLAAWAADAVWATSPEEDYIFRGREAILAAVQRQWETFPVMQHTTNNHTIELDGDSATGRAEVVVMVQLPDQSWLLGGGTYVDTYTRNAGSWRIARRAVERPFDLGPLHRLVPPGQDAPGDVRLVSPD